jgi:maleylacetoacetate isomerase
MRLYHYWRSSASWRVRWALAIKGVRYESVAVDLLAREQGEAAHRKRNPIGHVPVLEVDGRDLAESVAILEWLEGRYPEPALYPGDPWGRARVRQLCETINAGVQPLQNLAVLGRLSTDAAVQREWAAHFNERGLAAYEALLASFEAEGRGRFSWGDSLTAADLFLVPQVYSARRWGVDLSPFPRVEAVEAAARATPHAEGARPENQPGSQASR